MTRLLDELVTELRERRYRPLPARRVFILKPGTAEQRPLSIPAVRDRIVQAAVRIVLEPIFEADMLDCSFGFRPRRSAHDALQVLIDESWKGRRWVVETDIANCFEAIPHAGLMQAIEERVCDRAILGLVRGMLRAGVMEAGSLRHGDTGTPQGGVRTPPTQWATSSSRCGCRIGAVSGCDARFDTKGSMRASCRAADEPEPTNGHSGSTPQWRCWPPATTWPRRHGDWLAGMGCRSAKPAATSSGPATAGRSRCPEPWWCSPSSSQPTWPVASAASPGPGDRRSARSWPRRSPSSWTVCTHDRTGRADDDAPAAGRGGAGAGLRPARPGAARAGLPAAGPRVPGRASGPAGSIPPTSPTREP